MGSLALAMAGVITLAPVLAAILKPVVVPVFGLLGADPAMFAGTILACDMGGGALAVEMTANAELIPPDPVYRTQYCKYSHHRDQYLMG